MLVVAAPLLLARQSPRLVLPLVIVGIVGLVSALMLGADLPLLSRMNELDTGGASGSMRLVVPLNSLIKLLSDPSYLFTGAGAGSTTSDLGSAWPMPRGRGGIIMAKLTSGCASRRRRALTRVDSPHGPH